MSEVWWQYALPSAPRQILADDWELYQDAAKAVPAGLGNLLYTWGDLSSNGFDEVQALAPNRPTVAANGIDFDGANSWMAESTITGASNNVTAIYVIDPDTVAGTQTLYGGTANELYAVTGGNVAVFDGALVRAGCVAKTGPQCLAYRLNSAAGTSEFFRDGQRLQNGAYDNTWNWLGAKALGARFDGAAGWFNGRVRSKMIWDRYLGDQELAFHMALMMARYKLAFSPLSVASIDFWHTFLATYLNIVGGDVTQSNDRSGLGRNFIVPGGANAPAWNAIDQSIDFDNANTEALRINTWGRVQPCTNIGELQVSVSNTVNHTAWDGAPVGNSCRLTKWNIAPGNIAMYSGNALISADPVGNAWKRIATVYNGATSSLYIDGVLAAGPANVGANNPGGITIGRYGSLASPGDPRFRNSLMGYSRDLSQDEVLALTGWLVTG